MISAVNLWSFGFFDQQQFWDRVSLGGLAVGGHSDRLLHRIVAWRTRSGVWLALEDAKHIGRPEAAKWNGVGWVEIFVLVVSLPFPFREGPNIVCRISNGSCAEMSARVLRTCWGQDSDALGS